jgi:Ser/Thr protein kinase RdoA (MazF antagonist)
MPPRDQIETAEFRQVAASLAKHWTDKPMVLVRHFVNSVYRVPGEPAAYLRITPATHRSRAQIESELQVLRHVGSSGVAVSQPVESRSGDLIHTAAASDATYAACLFTMGSVRRARAGDRDRSVEAFR